ncbi:hypothetical protein [Natronomonas marina]|uniref:hypothetical protein n=1 Tax=Natronomonas marina TaxID=2961939 RepID=UPI0020C9A93C|nr:hypothetical protein [Natronomonas marina]
MTKIPFVGDVSISANGILIAGLLFIVALILGGVLGVPEGTGVQLVVALELLALYLLLHELDSYSFPAFVAIGAVTTVIALSATGEPVIASILNSNVGVILVVGSLYLLYRWLRQRGDDNQTIVVRGRRGGGGGS